jgi:hypothetical protein
MVGVVTVLVVLGAVLVGCSPSPHGGGESACESAVAAAAAVDANSDTVADLDPALRNCTSIAELKAASDKYPAAFDGVDPVVFATNRCASSSAPTGAAICMLVK